jgi:preprotein translocase SecE subunit
MATAVETGSQPPKAPAPPASLFAASLLGAVYVVAAVAVVFYAVPMLWAQYVTPQLGGNRLMGDSLLLLAQAAAAVGLVAFGSTLGGSNPPRGVRGGIFLVISLAIAIFFITRSVGLSVEATSVGQPVTIAAGVVLLLLALRLLAGDRGRRWMVALEEGGWFHTNSYKRALGQKVRRLTILGILLVGGSGAYSLMFTGTLPEAWAIRLPFTDQAVTLLSNARYAVPLLIVGLTLWFAWRVVNMPAFAEFLIATEAEMNKVSWSTRKRLWQDTVVVLITTVFMALFLLVVDLFWGWLLSHRYIGVLPGKATTPDKGGAKAAARW